MSRAYHAITPVKVTDPTKLYLTARTAMLERSFRVVNGVEEKFFLDQETIEAIIGTITNPHVEGCIGVLLAHDHYVTPGCEISETFIVPAGPRPVS